MPHPWTVVATAAEEKRCELVISGPLYSTWIEKEGLDPGIFNVVHLNFLEITKTCLKEIPSYIGHLLNLTRVVVSQNELSTLPPEFGELKKLKFLDASRNAISELPPSLSELAELQSLNVSFNKLSALPPVSNMLKLVSLNICHNAFSEVPISVCDARLIHFTDLVANGNAITSVPAEIGLLAGLKVLDLADNQIVEVCGELGGCNKMKDLNLKGNKLKDKRLLKLVDQCHVKQVMDYIRSHCTKASGDSTKNAKSKKKSKQSKKNEVEEVTQKLDELTVLHVQEEGLRVVCAAEAAEVRPYVVCCKVLDVDLSDASLMKRFIAMQTKLHETVCEKRTAATIATHDFSKIQGNLLYSAKKPKSIKILPLGRKKELTAAELYSQLNEEADTVRKEKKKNTYSGIHKYLYLLKDKPVYPYLSDSSGLVISFPPITNSEGTKISSDTKSMLLEVTGNNLPTCRKVLDTLLLEMLKMGIGKKPQKDNKSSDEDEEEEEEEDSSTKNSLIVEQIKIVDEEGKLKVVYPSRADILSEGITVNRC